MGDHPVCFGHGVGSTINRNTPDFPFEHVRETLAEADLVLGNLETVLSRPETETASTLHSLEMRGQPEFVDGLVRTGFRVLNIANNHALQHGPAPLVETIDVLRRQGIAVAGARDTEGRDIPVHLDIAGLRIGILGFSLRPEKFHPESSVYSHGDFEHLLAAVSTLASRSDVTILSLHWGLEFMNQPSARQVQMANMLLDRGVTVLLGHHPHVLQPLMARHHQLVAFSLGNFVFDHQFRDSRHSVILDVTLDQSGVQHWHTIPVYINRRHQPVPRHRRSRPRVPELAAELLHPESAEDEPSYQRRAHRHYLAERWHSYLYFATHLYRYQPRVIVSSILRSIRRRFLEWRGKKEEVL